MSNRLLNFLSPVYVHAFYRTLLYMNQVKETDVIVKLYVLERFDVLITLQLSPSLFLLVLHSRGAL